MFGLCGHTVIAFLDALGKSRIRFVSTRHEQVAAHAADGYARASGKPGVLLTHLGPGLTNACTGVANAALDSIPMVVIAGDVPSYYHGRHPHQEVNLHQDADQFQIYRPFCKRVYRVDRVERSASRDGARVSSVSGGTPRSGARRRANGFVLRGSAGRRLSAGSRRDGASHDRRVGRRAHRRRARVRGASGPLRGRRRDVGSCHGGARRSRGSARSAGRAHTDGQGLPARRPSPAPRAVRVLGHADFERQMPHRRSDRRDRHAPRRGQFELVGFALHVLDSADASDSHRRGRGGDRPELSDRAGRRRRREARARRAGRRRSWDEASRSRTPPRRDRAEAARHSLRTGITSGTRISFRCGRSGFSRNCARRCRRTASS